MLSKTNKTEVWIFYQHRVLLKQKPAMKKPNLDFLFIKTHK